MKRLKEVVGCRLSVGADQISRSDSRPNQPITDNRQPLLALAFILLAAAASAQDIVIRDATILTVSHGRIEH